MFVSDKYSLVKHFRLKETSKLLKKIEFCFSIIYKCNNFDSSCTTQNFCGRKKLIDHFAPTHHYNWESSFLELNNKNFFFLRSCCSCRWTIPNQVWQHWFGKSTLESDRLFINYFKCLMNESWCIPVGYELKR
jgi:hypothetical protein